MWVLIALSIVLVAATILVARRRWRATFLLGLGGLAAMVIVRSAARRVVDDAAELAARPGGRAAIESIVGGASTGLLRLAGILLIVAAVAAVVAMFRRGWRRDDLVLAAAVLIGVAIVAVAQVSIASLIAGIVAGVVVVFAARRMFAVEAGTEPGVRPRAAVAVGLAALALVGVAPAAPVAAQDEDDAAALLEAYAPVLSLRRQSEPCGDGERFLPVAVDTIFGREDVVLRDADGEVVATAPTAADLAGGPEDRWIDLPGNTLDPGCSYEQWFDSLDADPAIYGRVMLDGDQVVAQYWFFWVYNQWNDVHEGDWEMMQVLFDAPVAGGGARGRTVGLRVCPARGLGVRRGSARTTTRSSSSTAPTRWCTRRGFSCLVLLVLPLVRQERRDRFRLR